jgi:hypothetical protein
MSRRPARVTQADVARAIRAVEQVDADRIIEIAPDGTIRILPAQGRRQAPVDAPIDDERIVDL